MLKSKTVFVLGAGASAEANLPVGTRLREIIAQKLDLRFEVGSRPIGSGDLNIFQVLRQSYPRDINEYLAACWRIRDGIELSPSIDDFVHVHQHDARVTVCGKMAIATSILESERNSLLWFKHERIDSTIDFSRLRTKWY